MKVTIPSADLARYLNALQKICDECRPILGSDQNPNKGTIRRIDQIATDALVELESER